MRGMRYGLGLAVLCGCFVLGSASEARADYEELMGPELSSGAYAAKVETEGVLYVSMTSDEVLRETEAGEYYLVLGDEGSGWLEVQAGETVGYLSAEEISIVGQEEMEAAEMAAAAEVLTASAGINVPASSSTAARAPAILLCKVPSLPGWQ